MTIMNRSTIASIYRSTRTRLLHSATRILRDAEDAEDIVQDVFLVIVQGRA
jgi:DNA-directed RNA polymerase specialized sigma24 family protein